VVGVITVAGSINNATRSREINKFLPIFIFILSPICATADS